jgi:hypothetical protein
MTILLCANEARQSGNRSWNVLGKRGSLFSITSFDSNTPERRNASGKSAINGQSSWTPLGRNNQKKGPNSHDLGPFRIAEKEPIATQSAGHAITLNRVSFEVRRDLAGIVCVS